MLARNPPGMPRWCAPMRRRGPTPLPRWSRPDEVGTVALRFAKAARSSAANWSNSPENALPAQVEAALRTVVDRASKAPVPVTVIGLAPVAALPEWSAPTRELVLSLFKDNAPLDTYLAGHGYEKLVVRIADEARSSKQWGPLEPYAAGLWSAAAIRDNPQCPGANALSLLAEAAMNADAPSAAATFSRSALRGPAGRVLFQAKGLGNPRHRRPRPRHPRQGRRRHRRGGDPRR
jgi:hypothetical protein